MIVFKVTFTDADQGTLLSWHRTRQEADASLEEWQSRLNGCGTELVEKVSIPTSNRDALIGWLNSNLNTDNG